MDPGSGSQVQGIKPSENSEFRVSGLEGKSASWGAVEVTRTSHFGFRVPSISSVNITTLLDDDSGSEKKSDSGIQILGSEFRVSGVVPRGGRRR